MRHKREEARCAADSRRAAMDAKAAEEALHRESESRARAAAEEVITPLRLLGFRADEARRAAALCEAISDAPLEARLRRALSCLAPRPQTPGRALAGLGSAP